MERFIKIFDKPSTWCLWCEISGGKLWRDKG